MRAVIQRVNKASVEVDNTIIGKIDEGLLVLIGIENEDSKQDAEWLASKIVKMRVFADNTGLMNLDITDINGELLVISQFTLFASTKKGNRPSFINSAKPDIAIPLYNYFLQFIKNQLNIPVKSGIFGADMKVSLVNNGPVTIIIDTKKKE
ncbi:MAG TPA: D-aminoacyl-tRNA deacylase [Saprospiraceae bacterium]|nr:D-tyrosyl-tRNA(Tyr) deacylase [Saprospiraceae bacterium]MCC6687508.1 D-tyrosyl-tRNA(Tyr) deacylase [Saprospiraceae bacterium]HMV23160.1 D-aminoacyl-tRNA deacylase [Saprospiraceae bacterium]HMW74005.1 D-aminoacyl-tRNA deacylase [Saprospiraceae bacterium]HMX81699.1 D-aminoacyl-tRNA deacylase [Saprospiraceae bacterium]